MFRSTCGIVVHHFPSPTSAGIDLIAAFYGCLYAGVIPVTVRPPHPQNLAATLPTVRMIIDVSALHHSFFFLLKYFHSIME